MKKTITMAILAIMVLFTATACTTSKSYTFNVSTGDKIKLELNTTDGYDITSDLPFVISKDGNTLSQGNFITIDGYNTYITNINNTSTANIIENSSKGNIEYIFYSYNNSEWNYIIKVKDSNTGLLLANNISQESAKECFDRLTISK